MKKLLILIPLIVVLAIVFCIDDADGRGRRMQGPPGAVGSGGGSGGSSGGGSGGDGGNESRPPEKPSSPGSVGGAEKGADIKDRPKRPDDALRDEIELRIAESARECISHCANGLIRSAFRGAQGDANRRAGDCPVPEHPARDPAPADEEGAPEPVKEQKPEK